MSTKQKTIIFLVLLFSVVFCKTSYSFTLTAGINHVKINQSTTITLDVTPGSPGDYTYEWSTDIGSIQGTGNIVTYNAPGSKGKATISVTANSGGSPAYTGSVSLLVFKSIFVIKCDDLWGNPNVPVKWADYVDYMENTAKVKTALGINLGVGSTSSTYFDTIKGWVSRGYVTIYSHGYTHVDYRTLSAQEQLDFFTLSENTALTELGFSLEGFGAPGNNNNSDTTWTMNQSPQMKYWFFNDMNGAPDFDGFNFHMSTTRLDAETSGQHIDYNMYLGNYASYGNRDLNVIQIHPPWWSNPADLNAWDQVITHLKSEGVTIISPLDYYWLLNDPTFVPDERPGGGDSTPPNDISSVNDGTGQDIDITSSISQISANWTASTDQESGISKYLYAIGTTQGGTNTAPWTDNTPTNVTHTGVTLTIGTTYYFTVKAVNGASLESNATNSDGQWVDAVLLPVLQVNPSSLDFGEVEKNRGKILSFTITNTGVGDEILSGTISDDKSWITVNPKSFSSNSQTVSVLVDNSILAKTKGTYTGTVSITSNGGNAAVTVAVTATCVFTRPNPYNLRSGNLTFFGSGVPDSTIKIYTLAGELVKILEEPAGSDTIEWNGRNESGDEVISGIYLYTTKNNIEKNACSFTVIKK
jgi:hypothetical protein